MKTVKVGVFSPNTAAGSTIYLQSALTTRFAPGPQLVCAANLAARHVNNKDASVVPTMANLTTNVSVELYYWDSALLTQAALPGFFWMREQGVHAIVTDGNSMTDYVGQVAAVFQLPTCGYLSTDPDLSSAYSYPYVALMRATDDAAATAMCNLVKSYNWHGLGIVQQSAGQFDTYVQFMRTACPAVGVDTVTVVSYDWYPAEQARSNATYETAMELAADAPVNIWAHIGFYQAGPVVYALAEAHGMLADKYVWVNHELMTWGDIVRLSGSQSPPLDGAGSVERLHGMLQLAETYGGDSFSRFKAAYTDPANTAADCAGTPGGGPACDGAGACSNSVGSYNRTDATPWGADIAAHATTRVPVATPAADFAMGFLGLWSPPHETTPPVYDCVVALAAAFAMTADVEDGAAVMDSLKTVTFEGASGEVKLDPTTADRVAGENYTYSIFNWRRCDTSTSTDDAPCDIGLTSVLVGKIRPTPGSLLITSAAGVALDTAGNELPAPVFRDETTAVPADEYVPPGAQCLPEHYAYTVTGCDERQSRQVTYAWLPTATW